MSEASFDVAVTERDRILFAELSGDWNPLHSDPDYAAQTAYRRPVLHGAFSAGLISRLAGMFLPGRECLLHSMRLRFVRPVIPPVALRVSGRQVSGTPAAGRVEVSISGMEDGALYVDGAYDFGLHDCTGSAAAEGAEAVRADALAGERILVTGASGGLAGAVLARLGERGLGVSRSGAQGAVSARVSDLRATLPSDLTIAGIVHCAWPMPDNRRLVGHPAAAEAIDTQVAGPLREIQELATLLAERGKPGAPLVLIGSSFAEPGRHDWRMPLYSLSKSMLPNLARILAVELAPRQRRCFVLSFDVIDGGMNAGVGAARKLAHADRSPWGRLASPEDAADQVMWALDNGNSLLSGASISLTGGALP